MKRLTTLSHESRQRLPQSARHGSVTVLAIAVLAILTMLIAQHVRRVLIERRHFRQEIQHLQAEKLAEAGLEIAAAERQKNAAWSGIQWNVPAGTIHQTNTAEVSIRMQEEICTVIARYPANSKIPFQVTRIRKLTP